ncbi:hypothetical protein DXB08_21780, partial [Hungatella hathewayi]
RVHRTRNHFVYSLGCGCYSRTFLLLIFQYLFLKYRVCSFLKFCDMMKKNKDNGSAGRRRTS